MYIIYKQNREINGFCEFALSNFATVVDFVDSGTRHAFGDRLPRPSLRDEGGNQLPAFSASHHTVRKRRSSDS